MDKSSKSVKTKSKAKQSSNGKSSVKSSIKSSHAKTGQSKPTSSNSGKLTVNVEEKTGKSSSGKKNTKTTVRSGSASHSHAKSSAKSIATTILNDGRNKTTVPEKSQIKEKIQLLNPSDSSSSSKSTNCMVLSKSSSFSNNRCWCRSSVNNPVSSIVIDFVAKTTHVYKQTSTIFQNPMLLPSSSNISKQSQVKPLTATTPINPQLNPNTGGQINSSDELSSVISLPILTVTPSLIQNFDSQTSIISFTRQNTDQLEKSVPEPVELQQQQAGNEGCSGYNYFISTMYETLVTDLQSTNKNSVSSNTATLGLSLQQQSSIDNESLLYKCGSCSATHSKRYLISIRNLYDVSMDPIGVVYGPIKAYHDCRTNVTHVLTRTKLVVHNQTTAMSMDICQVDEYDTSRMYNVYQLETKG